MNNLVDQEVLDALAKLSAEMRRMKKGKHYESFAFKVYEYTLSNFWEWVAERKESSDYLEGLMNGAIEKGKNDHAKKLIKLNSQILLSEELYFKVVTVNALMLEKDNKIAELENDKFKMSDRIKELEIEVKKLMKVIENGD